MQKAYPFDPNVKHHIIIGVLFGLWIFAFLYLTEPLDVSEFSPKEKLIYLPGYGAAGLICYLLLLPFQYLLYQKNNQTWSLLSEGILLFGFCTVSIVVARIYYLWVVVPYEPNPYTLGYALKNIYLPAIAIILPIIIVARYAFGKYHEKRLNDQKITIKGEGNYEGLRLHMNDLISINSSDNYIEIHYRSGNDLKKTLIRNKLSVIDEEFSELLRTHRSYLINPFHFRQWQIENGKHSLWLNYDIGIPVSKTYLKEVKVALHSTTN